jgi:hypothetical protein
MMGSESSPGITPTVNVTRVKPEVATDLQDLASVSAGPDVAYNGPPGSGMEGGNWPDLGPAFPLTSPDTGPASFPQASVPAQPPFDSIPVPQHVSTGAWQMSFYDATATEPASVFTKLQSGPLDITTGRPTGEGFHQGKHRFRQV